MVLLSGTLQGGGTPICYVLWSASLVKIKVKQKNNLGSWKLSFIPFVKSQNKIYKILTWTYNDKKCYLEYRHLVLVNG